MINEAFKKMNINKEIISNNIKYILYILFAILPFANNLVSFFLIVLLVMSVSFGDINNWKLVYSKNKWFIILPITFYLYHIISIVFLGNFAAGFIELEHKLSFLVIPIFLPFIRLSKAEYSKAFMIFTITNLLLSLLIIGYFIFVSKQATNEYFGVHRGYLAMYFSISIVYILSLFSIENKKRYRWGFIISLLPLVFATFIMNTKAGILISMGVIITYLILEIKYYPIFSVVFVLLTIVFLLLSKDLYQEIFSKFNKEVVKTIELMENDNVEITKYLGSSGHRLLTYKSSVDLIAKKPLHGFGVGGCKNALLEQNTENRYITMIRSTKGLNAHNDFLETAIELGIFGAIILLANYTFIILSSIRKHNYLILSIFIIFYLNGMIESILVRQAGIIPFVLFSVIYAITLTNNKK